MQIQLFNINIKKVVLTTHLIIFMVFLSGCGSLSSSDLATSRTTNSQQKPLSQGAAVPSQQVNVSPNASNLVMNGDGLSISSSAGLVCPEALISLLKKSNVLVLSSNRLTYDQGELQALRNYVLAVWNGENDVAIPSSLRWVLGGDPSSVLRNYGGQMTSITGDRMDLCSMVLEITNTSNTTVQIPYISLKLTQQPTPNSFVYRLIDACSFLSAAAQSYCVVGSGAFGCSVYTAGIIFSNEKVGASVGSIPESSEGQNGGGEKPCPEMTILPHQVGKVNILVTGNPQIYTVYPEITVSTVLGQKIIDLTQFKSRIAFSD
jgi:hypothetical protein